LNSGSFEISRKVVHLLSLLVPAVTFFSVQTAQVVLIAAVFFYAYAEWRKVRGDKFGPAGFIQKMQRGEEKKTWARAPLFLAIGVLAAITFFSWKGSFIGIYQVGFCDTVAAAAGRKWGRTRLPFMPRKTYVGTISFFLAALPVMMMFLPPSKAIVLALVGAFLESLPFKDWDNLTIPIIVTFLADQFLV